MDLVKKRTTIDVPGIVSGWLLEGTQTATMLMPFTKSPPAVHRDGLPFHAGGELPWHRLKGAATREDGKLHPAQGFKSKSR